MMTKETPLTVPLEHFIETKDPHTVKNPKNDTIILEIVSRGYQIDKKLISSRGLSTFRPTLKVTAPAPEFIPPT